MVMSRSGACEPRRNGPPNEGPRFPRGLAGIKARDCIVSGRFPRAAFSKLSQRTKRHTFFVPLTCSILRVFRWSSTGRVSFGAPDSPNQRQVRIHCQAHAPFLRQGRLRGVVRFWSLVNSCDKAQFHWTIQPAAPSAALPPWTHSQNPSQRTNETLVADTLPCAGRSGSAARWYGPVEPSESQLVRPSPALLRHPAPRNDRLSFVV